MGAGGGGVAHTAHLGGLVVGYIYLKGLRMQPLERVQVPLAALEDERARGKFDVYSAAARDDDQWKSDWKKHIH